MTLKEGERLAAVEVKVENAIEAIARVDTKMDAITSKLDDGYARKEEMTALRTELEAVKNKKTVVQSITTMLLFLSLIFNIIEIYRTLEGK